LSHRQGFCHQVLKHTGRRHTAHDPEQLGGEQVARPATNALPTAIALALDYCLPAGRSGSDHDAEQSAVPSASEGIYTFEAPAGLVIAHGIWLGRHLTHLGQFRQLVGDDGAARRDAPHQRDLRHALVWGRCLGSAPPWPGSWSTAVRGQPALRLT
jgi:hypothetical protein